MPIFIFLLQFQRTSSCCPGSTWTRQHGSWARRRYFRGKQFPLGVHKLRDLLSSLLPLDHHYIVEIRCFVLSFVIHRKIKSPENSYSGLKDIASCKSFEFSPRFAFLVFDIIKQLFNNPCPLLMPGDTCGYANWNSGTNRGDFPKRSICGGCAEGAGADDPPQHPHPAAQKRRTSSQF